MSEPIRVVSSHPDVRSLGSSVPAVRTSARPKILLYSHDTFGLGNIRRTLLLSQELMLQYPSAAVLIITGSPMIHAFRIPSGVDYIKLPCLDRLAVDDFQPRYLYACSKEVKRTRQDIIKDSVLAFDPDLMIVDKRPTGVGDEIVPTLHALRQRHRKTKLVLGLRDILDDSETTIRSLARSRSFESIEEFYDEVWIYGVESLFNAVKEYAFPGHIAAKTVFCGYLKRPTMGAAAPHKPPRVLVTTGGGGDGSDIIGCYLEGLASLPRRQALRSTVMFGPQMSAADRVATLENYAYMSDVSFLDFEPDLTHRYAETDLVVSMAGYNTVCELLSMGRRAILVPRAEPVREQLIRARLFAKLGFFDILEPANLSPEILIKKVLEGLGAAPQRKISLDMEGLPRIRDRVRHLLHS